MKPSNLQIDSERLWRDIHDTAKFGGTAKGGVKRLTLSAEDKQVRDWFRSACEQAGCEVHVDALGTMFAIRPGRDNSKLAIGLGSHLDTQPTGGKYDGVLGTLAALEVVRTLNDAGIETDAPLCVVNWTNEEGSRFAPATMASAAYAGEYTAEDILSRRDADGISVADALDTIGYRGAEAVGKRKFAGFVELHIEQGPILEAEAKTIGVVEAGPGIAWFDGSITGFASHAGTTPMPLRRDALLALSELALAVEQAALTCGPHAVATIGEVNIENASRNVVPGEIRFTIDARSSAADVLDKMHDAFRRAVTDIAARRDVGIELIPVWRKEPTMFDARFVEAIAQSSSELGYASRRITSGAIHDTCNLASVIPAAMIFVPCKDGISHNELEDATQADCAAGANVLLHTVLKLADIANQKG